MRQIREVIALAIVVISAYTDIKERSIYTMPLVVSAAGAAVMSFIMIICAPAGEECDILLSELAGPALVGALIIFATMLFGKHMGEGDGYLLAALCMVTGIRENMLTILLAAFTAFIYAWGYVIAGKIRRRRFNKDIPFAPFVMIGFLLVIVNGAF